VKAPTAKGRCFAAGDCWKWGEKRDFIARTAREGEPLLVASLARGDDERLKSESLIALSEEKQKQILHFVQDDATAREGSGQGVKTHPCNTARVGHPKNTRTTTSSPVVYYAGKGKGSRKEHRERAALRALAFMSQMKSLCGNWLNRPSAAEAALIFGHLRHG